jgi:hypothetical protein
MYTTTFSPSPNLVQVEVLAEEAMGTSDDEVFAGSDLSQMQNLTEKISHNHDHPHLDN